MEALIYRVKEINELLPWCSSRKHLAGATEALPAPCKLTEFELCTMVFASSMRHVLMQYNSGHGTTFACDLPSLTRLLECATDQVQTNHNLLNQYKSITSGHAGASDGSKNGRIPKKARFADPGDKEPGEVSRLGGNQKRECDRCAKWKSEVKHTHWNKDCKIWNEDGSHQPRGNDDRRGGVRGHKSIIMPSGR